MMQEMISASRSELKCRNHELLRTGYCPHSSLTLAVKLRKNMMQEMISASRSELKCRNHELL